MSLKTEDNSTLHKYNTKKEDLIFHPISWHGYDVDDRGEVDEDDEQLVEENQYENKYEIKKKYRISIYGRNQYQEAISLVVNDFKPYFYILVDDNWTVSTARYLKDSVESCISKGKFSIPHYKRDDPEKLKRYLNFCRNRYSNEIVNFEIEKWEKMYWFTNHKKFKFVKITTKTSEGVRFLSNMLKAGISLPKCYREDIHQFETYLSNLDPILCFIHDRDLQPSNWMKVPASHYYRQSDSDLYVGHDFTAKTDKCEKHTSALLPEFRIASYDIEAVSEDGSFPDPSKPNDKVIQIGTTYHKYGSKDCYKKTIVVLGDCDDIEGVEVYRCKTEKEVILRWVKLIQETDPDILTGYNIWGFDWSFLHERSKLLKCEELFMKLGRRESVSSIFVNKTLSSSALGENHLKYVDMEGRCQIDLYKLVMRDHKLGSYKLDSVAEHFLGDRKVDLKPSELFRKFREFTSKSICDIATYCVQDCELCNRLMNKLEVLPNNLGMSNVCLIPLYWLFYRGQGIKIFSLVAKECKDAGILVPVLDKYKNKHLSDDTASGDDDSYEGAIVLVAKPGVYLNPVSCLDFASLYPSTMNAENLSHNSLCLIEVYDQVGEHVPSLDRGNRELLKTDGYHYNILEYDNFTGSGDDKVITGKTKCYFMERDEAVDDLSKKDIIPLILQKLLGARKTTRNSVNHKKAILNDGTEVVGFMKETDDKYIFTTPSSKVPVELNKSDVKEVGNRFTEFQKKVLDGLQLAYKLTANSLYGQCGAPTSDIYCKEIAASTTAGGRDRLRDAYEKAERLYPGAVCVYGDTDSIFVNFQKYWEDVEGLKLEGKDALRHSIELGMKCSKEISATLKKPHDLEYEKTFMPFIQFAKKRYEGLLYEDNPDKCVHKSMGTVLKRRDNAPIVKRIFGGCVDIVLREGNFDRLQEFFINEVRNLLDGNMSIEDLIISKTLKASYKNPDSIAHKALADRMAERGNKPQSNDRIPYVYIDIGKPKRGVKVLQGDKIEHPDYIMENKDKIKPDYLFYIEHQVKAPCMQLFGLILEKLAGYREGWMDWNKVSHLNGKKFDDKIKDMREKEAEKLLLSRIVNDFSVKRDGGQSITNFFKTVSKTDMEKEREKFDIPVNLQKIWKNEIKMNDVEKDLIIDNLHKINRKEKDKKAKAKETKKNRINKARISTIDITNTEFGNSCKQIMGMIKQAGEYARLKEDDDDKTNKIMKMAAIAEAENRRRIAEAEDKDKESVTDKYAPVKNTSNSKSKVKITLLSDTTEETENKVNKIKGIEKHMEDDKVDDNVNTTETPKKIIVMRVKKQKNVPITLRKKKLSSIDSTS